MAKYATHYYTYTFLKQEILMENLMPDNLDQARKLDDFVCDILKDKHKQKYLDIYVTFEKICSPSNLWMLVEEARRWACF